MDGHDSLRIALFTHSTNPRGGVVHALELAEAMQHLGHLVVVHAPDATGQGFFRPTCCPVALVPADPVTGGLAALVQQRIEEYVRFLQCSLERYDIYHAQDGISANALATLVERGILPLYLRTIHHMDDFADHYLRDCQDRSILTASRCFCVSKLWQGIVRKKYAVDAAVVPNGVNASRYTPLPGDIDNQVRHRLGMTGSPVFLAVGGVESRKNTVSLLRAFLPVQVSFPQAQLVIVGGASLLNHDSYQREFQSVARSSGLLETRNLILAGIVDDADMPALFRLADALIFPSVKEGFGLVVLEAMASGTPVVCPQGAPFDEYLNQRDALFIDSSNIASISAAMRNVLQPTIRASLATNGLAVSRRFPWRRSAEAHLQHYRSAVTNTRRSSDASDALPSAMAR
jgi:glycosyltransferase-like protein